MKHSQPKVPFLSASRCRWIMMVVCLGLLSAFPASAADCPSTVVNCTANDFDVENVMAVPFGGDTCTDSSDSIDLLVSTDLSLQGGGGARLDIGVWIPDDGLGLTCAGNLLEDATATNWSNLDMDLCGDVEGGNVIAFSAVYTVPCVDDDLDGILDPFLIEVSWVQPGGNIANCVVPTVAPGTTAKCTGVEVSQEVRVPFCGDAILDEGLGEECDDGNIESGDGCSALCEIEGEDPFCGDGQVDPGEDCDDGDIDNTDECLNTCSFPTCGDGFLWAGNEDCDDGNNLNGDGCSDVCTVEVVPSMTTWAYIVLAIVLLSLGAFTLVRLERRRQVQ